MKEDDILCVAAFRVVEFLTHGRFLYVDDQVADEGEIRWHGKRMLDWLAAEARSVGCEKLQPGSGVQRYAPSRGGPASVG